MTLLKVVVINKLEVFAQSEGSVYMLACAYAYAYRLR